MVFGRNHPDAPPVVTDKRAYPRPPQAPNIGGAAHAHSWVEQRRVYTKSTANIQIERCDDRDLVRELAFGVTTIELRCGHCGDITSRTLIGRVIPPPTTVTKTPPGTLTAEKVEAAARAWRERHQ